MCVCGDFSGWWMYMYVCLVDACTCVSGDVCVVEA